VAAPIFRLDVDVEQVAARSGARVERVRRPVEEKQASAGNDFAIVFGEPAEVAAVVDGLSDPRFVGLGHELENLVVPPAGINKHTATMASDERSVGGRRQPRLQHEKKYKT